jgi:type I restriction-modification system DNA methylase subunit
MMIPEDAVRRVQDFDSLLELFREKLRWDLNPEVKFDESTFDWSADELSLSDSVTDRLKDGIVRQLQPLRPNQKWGIFFVEFTDTKIYRTALRQILRRLVPSRLRESHLASWDQENLLFICATSDYKSFTFAHFKKAKSGIAKLSTFGWQVGDRKLRTLCEFNLPALVWPADDGADTDAWVAIWSKAFDKEPLTRDFFKRFDNALEKIKADLEEIDKLPSAAAHTKSQLLLERLIFLYYLQNRGWLNQQRNYLVDNFASHRERPKEYSYYSDFLEKLFWTLASPPGSAARIYGIPFLNGGLFDDDEFAQNPMRRKHNPPLSIRNSTFSFVFDEFLEAFNFTVREDTPLNQEVAVDPEMLGKVFESIVLHAEAADPDAVAPDKRKATGSYYTPRIVVHFICQETLRQYLIGQLPNEGFTEKLGDLIKVDASDGLDKDELQQLKKLLTPNEAAKLLPLLRPKCCDPAVGSGAFPVGLLHELVNLNRVVETVANGYVDPIRKHGTQWLHETKSEIIQNCLYGVDIQQQAIEICQLRLWLSLVVDYDLGIDPFTSSVPQFREAIERISQLPNLEMNFRRGDSLHDYISGVPLIIPPDESHDHRADFEEIKKLGTKLHQAKKGTTKRKLRLAILERRLDISQRVLDYELEQLRTEESTFINRLFTDETQSRVDKHRRVEEEIGRVQEAQRKVVIDRRELNRLKEREADNTFQQKLRRLEGADFDSPLNCSWPIDFASVFANGGEHQTVSQKPQQTNGFDMVVGNPPFVTPRNAVKRRLWRERWYRVCTKNYQMVCPFFDLGFNLLRQGGQLGYIVSNAFAKREFGRPLVEEFFPTVTLQKVLDCSGLMFPGHGTPTCIVFGSNQKPDPKSLAKVAATLPGGGDLRTFPEESPLWHALEERHDEPGYQDNRVMVVARPQKQLTKWPWQFDTSNEITRQLIESNSSIQLSRFVDQPVGHVAITRTDDVFILPNHTARQCQIEVRHLKFLGTGETIRNWAQLEYPLIVFPYDEDLKPLDPENSPRTVAYLRPFRDVLENVVMHGSVRKKQTKVKWFEYSRLARAKLKVSLSTVLPEIATHSHALVDDGAVIFHQTVPVIKLPASAGLQFHHAIAGLLNSSSALFWLKQVCFSKRESQEGATDTYFVFAGGKIEQLPIPGVLGRALRDLTTTQADLLLKFSKECLERGKELFTLSAKKLFESSGEAYQTWNSSLPGYLVAHQSLAEPFATSVALRTAFKQSVTRREQLHSEMIARQEEIDWLVYADYSFITDCHPHLQDSDLSLACDERPFVLWARADGDLERAMSFVPANWSVARRELWRERLMLIRDNEHIRRIEQSIYKRRWDEQWKVGNRWERGQPAYDAELIDAFSWWLSEKAEWWLEQCGEPVSLDKWEGALWKDTRIQVAWPVIAEAQHRLELWKDGQKKVAGRPPVLDPSHAAFTKFFKALVKEQTVPERIPFGIPFDKLKIKVSAQVKSIRGTLNVPRERFNVTEAGLYRVASAFTTNALSEGGSPTRSTLPFE